MLVENFAAPMFATNTWIIAASQGSECLIFDAGMPDTSKQVEEIVERFKLKPVAIIATHGHLDHTFSIRPVADGYSIPTYIHSEDRFLLLHPERALSAEFAATFNDKEFLEPLDVRDLRNGDEIEIVGMKVRAFHTPGHTRGSMIFSIDDEILVSGDVLFAGSIGRTDLPTGSAKDMQESLRNKIMPLDDALRVLPGHGPETTIGYERQTNPYLKNFAKQSSKNKGRF